MKISLVSVAYDKTRKSYRLKGTFEPAPGDPQVTDLRALRIVAEVELLGSRDRNRSGGSGAAEYGGADRDGNRE